MEHQLSRLETAVHNMTMRLMQVSEKVVSIEAELGRRKHLATQKRKERKRRIQGALTMTNDSFRPDPRLPYPLWARVCYEFGLRGMTAGEFCRWVVVEWIRQYQLHNRKKVLSLTSGRVRYFEGGVQCSCAEVDMFGRKHLHRRRHEVGEIYWWNWCDSHMRLIVYALHELPGYGQLPERFRKQIDFANATYSELRIGNSIYDPQEPSHQTPQAQQYIDAIFTRGFRKGVQNQAQHNEWVVQRNIQPLVNRAKILSSDI